jgi:two-component system response regulator HydG
MKKCLIVDDVEVTRFTVEEMSVLLGLEVKSAATADEAYKIIEANSIDVVLLDWHLRKASGIDVLKEIKAKHGSRIKVVMISGVEQADKAREAREAGADAFLQKPTTLEHLKDCFTEIKVL